MSYSKNPSPLASCLTLFHEPSRLFDVGLLLILPSLLIIFLWDETAQDVAWPRPDDPLAAALQRESEIPGGFVGLTVMKPKLESHFRQFSEMGLGNLEVVVLEEIESLREETDLKMLGLSVGKTITAVEAPVTFRFHVSFNGDWRILDDGRQVTVYCPGIAPSLPATIHLSQMKAHAEDGLLRFDKDEQLERTEKKFLPLVNSRARIMVKDSKVREKARTTIQKFAETFFSEGKPVRVVFPDETVTAESGLLSPP